MRRAGQRKEQMMAKKKAKKKTKTTTRKKSTKRSAAKPKARAKKQPAKPTRKPPKKSAVGSARPAPQPVSKAPVPAKKPAVVLKAGARVRDQSVTLTDGSVKTLSALAGQSGLVLYFYPKDNTPGCTKEACSFRDNLTRLTSFGYGVAGVSPDSPKSHVNFTEGYSLNFPLIADVSKSLCEQFGVWQEKSLYGRKYMGVARTTFVLGSDLTIKRVFEHVKVDGHVDEVIGSIAPS